MNSRRWFGVVALILGAWHFHGTLSAQSSDQGQIRGTVSDSSEAVLPGARITITDTGTNISQKTTSNSHGLYIFTALPASHYTILVEAAGFGTVEKSGITLTVNQQTTLDITLAPAKATQSVTVESVPVLLDSDNATLGTDIGTNYLTQIPLENRDPFGLAFIAAGVTEAAGSGINDSYPAGTNFVSNGQRNATAEIRLDGTLTTAPEQGEGGTSNIYYQATVEALQEVKVQNNSFSAEYGNNGGTVIDEVMKSGTNALHGSAYEFNQNSVFDARDEAALAREGMDAASLADMTWRDQMRTSGEARTQSFARRLIAAGCNGLMVRSFAAGSGAADVNLVLWRWGDAAPARLVLIDDEGRLKPHPKA